MKANSPLVPAVAFPTQSLTAGKLIKLNAKPSMITVSEPDAAYTKTCDYEIRARRLTLSQHPECFQQHCFF